jgi:hypothetical protein
MLVTIGWLLYSFNDRISQQEQSGWSMSDASAWRLSFGGINDSVADQNYVRRSGFKILGHLLVWF